MSRDEEMLWREALEEKLWREELEEKLWQERLQSEGIKDFNACLCKKRPARQELPKEILLQVSQEDMATLNRGQELAGSVIMRYLQVKL